MLEEVKKVILNALQTNDRSRNNLAVYAFTNENIKAYLEGIKGRSALSVCSSGDQYFNLIGQNFLDIDLIDINPLAEYYALGIKQALILGFSYEEYLKVITLLFKKPAKELEKEILEYLLKWMLPKYQIFWQEIFNYYFKLQEKYQREISLLQILTQDYYFDLEEIIFLNHYLEGKEKYEKTKHNLLSVNSNFILGNILNHESSKKYDLILCSNILEYFYHPNLDIKRLHQLYQPLLNMLNEQGIIYADYIYGLYQDKELRTFPIGGANITGRELLKEEIKLIPNYRGKDQNAVLILRRTCN